MARKRHQPSLAYIVLHHIVASAGFCALDIFELVDASVHPALDVF